MIAWIVVAFLLGCATPFLVLFAAMEWSARRELHRGNKCPRCGAAKPTNAARRA